MSIHRADLKPILPIENVPIVPSTGALMDQHLFTQVREAIEKKARMPMQELIEGLARQMRNVHPHGFPAVTFRPIPQGVVDHVRAQARSVSVLLKRQGPIHVSKEHVERLVCTRVAHEMHSGDQDAVLSFTTNVLGLPAEYMPWVAQALWDSDWRYADTPYAYVYRVTQTLYKKDSFWIDAQFVPLDVAADAEESLLTGIKDPLLEREIAIDVAEACQAANLSRDQMRLLDARLQGYTRRDVGAYLGWDHRKVEAEWRALTRAYPKLRTWLT